MRRIATAKNSFEAKVIAARLGSEGVIWELRGNVDGPLAFGAVEVLVAADDYDTAREILLVDDVEASFDQVDDGPSNGHEMASPRDLWVALIVIVLVTVFAIARMAAQA